MLFCYRSLRTGRQVNVLTGRNLVALDVFLMRLPTIGVCRGIPLDNVIRSTKTCSLSLHRDEDAHDALKYCCHSPTPPIISSLRAP